MTRIYINPAAPSNYRSLLKYFAGCASNEFLGNCSVRKNKKKAKIKEMEINQGPNLNRDNCCWTNKLHG